MRQILRRLCQRFQPEQAPLFRWRWLRPFDAALRHPRLWHLNRHSAAGGIAVGGTTIAADTGANTILAGDVVTFAADTGNKYIVGTALAAGSFAINKPGARVAIPDNNAITVGNSYLPNMVFSRNAFVLATRAPALPRAGDAAIDSMMLTDPISGLTFEVRVYAQYRQVKYEVCLAWGVNGVKPEHSALLLG